MPHDTDNMTPIMRLCGLLTDAEKRAFIPGFAKNRADKEKAKQDYDFLLDEISKADFLCVEDLAIKIRLSIECGVGTIWPFKDDPVWQEIIELTIPFLGEPRL
ncbi:MAG: hypothetical protein ACWA40_03670 [Planktomarina sp.]